MLTLYKDIFLAREQIKEEEQIATALKPLYP